MTTTTQPVTPADLLRKPADGFRYELVKGEQRRTSPAGHKHGRIAANVTGSLVPHVGRLVSTKNDNSVRLYTRRHTL